MNLERKSGILLHITSLPGKWGIGEIGLEARKFGEFLAASGQKLWQILPTNPVGYGYSPYSSNSAFAGNPLLISFDELIEEGLLTKRQLNGFPTFDANTIDFPAVIEARMKILNRVCDRFEPTQDFRDFCDAEASWLEDYALFVAIREAHAQRAWTDWPDALRDRQPKALKAAAKTYAAEILRHKTLQYLFFRHWKKMKAFFKTLDIEIVGDVPIFVAGDSADVWANRELFLLDEAGQPTVVAGVPPDYFCEEGQRWGNPLYDWKAQKAEKYAWWTRRMLRTLDLVDVVRIDHFLGFESYWEIPAEEPTAVNGRWVKGPGAPFFQALEKNMRKVPELGKDFCLANHVIAEDLGLITPAVEVLRTTCGFPGMTVLQFQFGAEPMAKKGYVPEGKADRVIYTGTHDNATTRAWLRSIDEEERHRIRTYLKAGDVSVQAELIELAMRSPARWAIIPIQDVLGKGRRMNTPGTVSGNWNWRVSSERLTARVAARLLELTTRNDR